MKIIITDTFEKKFLNKLKKYFSTLELVKQLKKDKKYGENIIWNTYKKQIIEMQERVAKDLENGKIKVY